MSAILIIVAAIVLLVLGYIFYGSWLAKQWGIDPSRKTPAVEVDDGVDYVVAKPAVLMGHHYSSIAGAGPINGPVQASVFGWLPVFLWCVIGGIFFGGLQDFGSMFASVRHGGKSLGEVIADTMGAKAKKLFIVFALLVLILVIASFVNVVANTFASDNIGFTTDPTGNETTAMVSVIFIILAIIYGIFTNRVGVKTAPATVVGVILIALTLVFALNFGLALNFKTWVILIGAYIVVASLVPVWILLQPRDYLSSYLLYAMMLVALFGIIFSAFAGTAEFQLPAFTGWSNSVGTLFPALFITVACGACSGFHSLIATGTTSKQLDNESHLKPIGYGSMLIESALAIIALIAVGMVFDKYTAGSFGSPAVAFSSGIATMFGAETSSVYGVVYALLTLAVSVFALTSLDSGTRLSRFMFTELFLKEGEATWKDAKGIRKFLAFPLTGTLFMVIVGCVLGGLKLSAIWGLFGAANQLLAGIALMAVAAWLGNIGKNNKMFFIPMIFMLIATLTSLIMTIVKKIKIVVGLIEDTSVAAWGHWFQLILAAAMVVLAIILVIQGIQTFSAQIKKSKEQKAEA
ncbi:MAG: carbon starvation protein A [Oscillospiraceae bacterium]|nr:carbon starvation protein A [Oscillospiraceae bacterium]